MHYAPDDTIAAIASAPGGGVRGIVRVSGPDVLSCLLACFEPAAAVELSAAKFAQRIPGRVWLTPLETAPRTALPCDLWYWPSDRSYTRSPVAEFHTLGSPPLLALLLRTICDAGARLAEPGEFTLRAFLAGRIDLTQAEAVLGAIDARNQRQFDAALLQLSGGLTQPLAALRELLIDLLAELEAGLDFVDEDIEFVTAAEIAAKAASAAASVDQLLAQMTARTLTADALRVVLWGSPNAGKSSLFNALAAGQQAIVSEIAGTTRDYLTATVDLDGLRCELVDTAGAEPVAGADSPRGLAQQFTDQQRRQAHLRLLCIDASQPPDDFTRQQLAAVVNNGPADNGGETLVVLTKIDAPAAVTFAPQWPHAIKTSSQTGAGLSELRQRLRGFALESSDIGMVAATAIRSRESLARASDCLHRAAQIARFNQSEELIAADLRAALHELGTVVGAVHTDDLLDRIFSRFCIGK